MGTCCVPFSGLFTKIPDGLPPDSPVIPIIDQLRRAGANTEADILFSLKWDDNHNDDLDLWLVYGDRYSSNVKVGFSTGGGGSHYGANYRSFTEVLKTGLDVDAWAGDRRPANGSIENISNARSELAPDGLYHLFVDNYANRTGRDNPIRFTATYKSKAEQIMSHALIMDCTVSRNQTRSSSNPNGMKFLATFKKIGSHLALVESGCPITYRYRFGDVDSFDTESLDNSNDGITFNDSELPTPLSAEELLALRANPKVVIERRLADGTLAELDSEVVTWYRNKGQTPPAKTLTDKAIGFVIDTHDYTGAPSIPESVEKFPTDDAAYRKGLDNEGADFSGKVYKYVQRSGHEWNEWVATHKYPINPSNGIQDTSTRPEDKPNLSAGAEFHQYLAKGRAYNNLEDAKAANPNGAVITDHHLRYTPSSTSSSPTFVTDHSTDSDISIREPGGYHDTWDDRDRDRDRDPYEGWKPYDPDPRRPDPIENPRPDPVTVIVRGPADGTSFTTSDGEHFLDKDKAVSHEADLTPAGGEGVVTVNPADLNDL